MKSIEKRIKIDIPCDKAFTKFVYEFNNWWPKEYTWSQETLEKITIGEEKNALCTEIGPNGFRIDWGRIIEFDENSGVKLKWQIGPNRDPIPDPDKASDITIRFESNGIATNLVLEHGNFDRHGEGANEYKKMMDSPQGWDYILKSYKKYSEELR